MKYYNFSIIWCLKQILNHLIFNHKKSELAIYIGFEKLIVKLWIENLENYCAFAQQPKKSFFPTLLFVDFLSNVWLCYV